MPEAQYAKLDIAREYLELAMQLYVEKHNYFCVIHLAGAAEELFGKHLPEEEQIITIEWKAQRALDYLLYGRDQPREARRLVMQSKNQIKHDDGEREVVIDPLSESRHWIENALINVEKLRRQSQYQPLLPKSPAEWGFEDCAKEEDAVLYTRYCSQGSLPECGF